MQRHAITANSVKNLLFDAGVVYMNFVNATTPGTLLGVTRGGTEFNSGIELRHVEGDGVPGRIKGWSRIVRIEPQLTVNLLEMSKQNFLMALAGGTEAITSELVGYDEIKLSQINDANYLDNLTFVGFMQDGRRAIIQIQNAMAEGDFSVSFADQDEANPSITFTGYFDPAEIAGEDDPMEFSPVRIWLETTAP